MRDRTKMNAMRSGVVVVGASAFGYLTLQLGFKPFLERAQVSLEHSEPASSSPSIESGSNTNRELAFTVPRDQNKFLADLESFLVYLCSDSESLQVVPRSRAPGEKDAEEEDWMAKWDRRRRMAVIQVLYHFAYALYLHQAYYRYHNQSAKSLKGKKRNAPID
ncbi:hypothetical protein FEM48_Zijuj07G0130500 [Ziziphus jujuba var. spinosa]|uniref:Uncharacterized protein n=1 Tax=Ziziphus jujuba var. spinosa TaxID=714518 RepID=A0A978V4T0_ZIZJJ|nr:hypothetical protein FEM48_Zijuj07G0130500 [Ziziphus jujuba var. spinosa]